MESSSLLCVRAALCGARLIRVETKASKDVWRVDGERSCDRVHVTGVRLERKLSSANFDSTGTSRQTGERKVNEGREAEGQPEAPLHQDKGKKAVNNKLIRNGCKIAMDERLAGVRRKKKSQSLSSEV